ncbi:IclR family transcriptional regulator [Agromyces silvae]|uniref:IclR family transcriptional regulator n=1 Tax=Agromyces silvae TaxID=3388266 RepID=UPI00280A81FF|nr:IclR family transcriptional regulator [Agromyces protaetiae]
MAQIAEESGTRLLTVQRALRVLDIVAESDRPLQVRDIARILGHNLSSTYHIVNTLVAEGHLRRRADGSVAIGYRIGVLASALTNAADVIDVAEPIVSELAAQTRETVYLTCLEDGAAVVRFVAESPQSLRISGLSVGYSGNEDRRASGRAILAQFEPQELESQLARLSRTTTRGDERIAYARSAIDLTRRRGYALDNEEFEEGVCCVAAAYFDPTGRVAGSIALSAPSIRAAQIDRALKDKVVRAASDVTRAWRG